VLEVPFAELGLADQARVEAVTRVRVGQDEEVGAPGQVDAGKGAGDAEQVLERPLEGALSSAARDNQRAVDVEEQESLGIQAASPLTFPARGPLADGSSSKLTR
jgi:hypothetical protein